MPKKSAGPANTEEHELRKHMISRGRWRAYCSCGWERTRNTEELVVKEATRHYEIKPDYPGPNEGKTIPESWKRYGG